MPMSIEDFLGQLQNVGVLTAADVAEFRPSSGGNQTIEDVARALVRAGRLTRFQAEQAYRGKAQGLVLGTYLLLDTIGAGGMGQVFKALHRRMDRVVAIKLLSRELSRDAGAVARFEREVRAAARINHPNIVAALDADQVGTTRFLVMEYVEGRDLAKLVKKHGPLSVPRAIECVLQAARGLAAAHALGIVHRDVKPANLLIDSAGTVKILDMGLARIHGDGHQADLTATGTVMGTVDYMAPEQAIDTKQADARADIYALGYTLWFLLCGRPAFEGDSLIAKLLAHRDAPIPDLKTARPAVPDTLVTMFRRMVAKRPEDRYQSMEHVITALEHCRHDGRAEDNGRDVPLAAEASLGLDSALDDTMASDAFAFGPTTPVVPTPGRRRWVPVGIAVALVVAVSIGLLGAWAVGRRSPAPRPAGETVAVTAPAEPVSAAGSATGGGAVDTTVAMPEAEPAVATAATVTETTAADRAATTWALERQGTVTILCVGREEVLTSGSPLPTTDWKVVAISRPRQGDWSRETLAVLTGLTGLRSLSLFECPVGAQALRVVGTLPALEDLDLQRTWCTDGMVESLRGMTTLKRLVLRDTRVTDAVSDVLGTLPQLEVLDLSNTRITGTAFDRLAACSRLAELSLDLLELNRGWAKPVAGLSALRVLRLNNSYVTNADLRELSGLDAVRTLEIGGTSIDDDAIPLLLGFPNVSYLQVDNAPLTTVGVEQLRAGLRPGTKLDARNPVPRLLTRVLRGEEPWQRADLTRRMPPAAALQVGRYTTLDKDDGKLVDGVLRLDRTWARLDGIEGRGVAVRAKWRPHRPRAALPGTFVQAGVILRDTPVGGIGFMLHGDGQMHMGQFDWAAVQPFRGFHYGWVPRARFDADGEVTVTVAVEGRSAFMWAGDRYRTAEDIPSFEPGGVVLGWLDANTWIRDVEYVILHDGR